MLDLLNPPSFLNTFFKMKPAAEFLKLCVAEGDLFGLGLALEAAAGDEALAEDHAAGVRERARLAGLAARYGAPEKGARKVLVEAAEAEAGWVAHSLAVDGAGRLTIRTMVMISCISSLLHFPRSF